MYIAFFNKILKNAITLYVRWVLEYSIPKSNQIKSLSYLPHVGSEVSESFINCCKLIVSALLSMPNSSLEPLKLIVTLFLSSSPRSVTDPRDGKRVALKKMPNVFQNLVSCKRVFRELKMLCFFKHENVSTQQCSENLTATITLVAPLAV